MVVKGLGDVAVPQLYVHEVGNDLSGNDEVASFEAEPLVHGLSETTWTIDAPSGGLFEGNGSELEFTAISPVGDSGDASYASSGWFFTN